MEKIRLIKLVGEWEQRKKKEKTTE